MPDGPERPDAESVDAFARARRAVLDAIAAACARAGRDPASVRLVAVSKTVPAERVRAAVAAGHDVFGENRVQEAEAKVPAVGAGEWHLIGPLQSNKARRALEVVDVIESVDSVELARRLDRIVRELGGLPAEGPSRTRAGSRSCSRSTSTGTPASPGSSRTAWRTRCRSWGRSVRCSSRGS